MDGEELAAIYASCGAAVERRCRALVGDDAALPDLVQEVFLRAVLHAASFRREASPFTWLYRVSTNLCLNHLRDRKQTLPIDLVIGRDAGGPRPDETVVARRALQGLLSQLDRRSLAVVVYHYLDEMSQEEIAEVSGWSRKTVGKKLAAFRERAAQLEVVR
jgi:RNA polymerase sigma-70 factor (ECF subfamily)